MLGVLGLLAIILFPNLVHNFFMSLLLVHLVLHCCLVVGILITENDLSTLTLGHVEDMDGTLV